MAAAESLRTAPKRRFRPASAAMNRFGMLLGLLPLVLGLLVWQLLGDPDDPLFPSPSSWFVEIGDMYRDGVLVPGLERTLVTFAASLVIATVMGALIGALIGRFDRANSALSPLMDLLRSLPPPVVVPVGALVLGATLQAGIAIVVWAIIWPIIFSTAAAMRAIPGVRREMARSLGMTPFASMQKVILPSLMPGIALGVRIAVSISLIVTLLVDILASGEGAGRLIVERQQSFNSAGVYGVLVVIGVFGFVINALVNAAESRLLRNWHGSAGR